MKRQDYISWDEYFMGIALLSAQRSKDSNTQVGACIVTNDNKILSLGYNGMPIGCDDDVFMLSVCGDSMINAGILDHDYIIARKQNFANNGDIVVALIDGEETTVKRYFRELRSVRLQPENDKYQPIVGSDNIQVLGKVISVFRML